MVSSGLAALARFPSTFVGVAGGYPAGSDAADADTNGCGGCCGVNMGAAGSTGIVRPGISSIFTICGGASCCVTASVGVVKMERILAIGLDVFGVRGWCG